MIDLVRRGWGLVAAAVVLAGVSAALTRLWAPGAVVTGLAAAASVVGGVWLARGSSRLQTRDTQHAGLGNEVWLNHARRLPKVRELRDPIALGVHPAAGVGVAGMDRVPRYVRRRVSDDLPQVLRQARFVLLVGESTAGKTRAAYELLRTELPRHRLVNPVRRESAQLAAELAAATPRSVLWLDDIERFLGSGGLTGAAVRNVLAAPGADRFIVATIRSEEYAGFSGRVPTDLMTAGRDVLRQGWDVLRLAATVEVARRWSTEDVDRARRVGEDPRLSEALRHTDTYGIAEYLAAGPQLLVELRNAWAPAAHPRAAALVRAAVDARRAGIHRPLPKSVLRQLHEPYLQARGGERLRPEPFEVALAWATDPLFATSSLLMPAADGYLAFDYLIDAVSRDRLPVAAVDRLISFATPDEAMDVGRLALGWSFVEQAETAFRHAEASGSIDATMYRCWLIRQERGKPSALRFAAATADRLTAELGTDHPRTVRARFLVGCETGNNGDYQEARRLLEDLADHATRVLGADDKLTLEVRDGAVQYSSDPAAGLRLSEELAGECARVLGEDDDLTISCRERIAFWTKELGDPGHAAELLRTLIADMTGRFRSPAADILSIRAEMAEFLAMAGQVHEALTEWPRIVADAAAMFGECEATSLELRRRHAWCAGETGDAPQAVALLRSLVADITTLDRTDLYLSLQSRTSLAWWTGATGEPRTAVADLDTVLSSATARDHDDQSLRAARHMRAYWHSVVTEATVEGACEVVDRMTRDLGLNHPTTRAARRDLATRFHAVVEDQASVGPACQSREETQP